MSSYQNQPFYANLLENKQLEEYQELQVSENE